MLSGGSDSTRGRAQERAGSAALPTRSRNRAHLRPRTARSVPPERSRRSGKLPEHHFHGSTNPADSGIREPPGPPSRAGPSAPSRSRPRAAGSASAARCCDTRRARSGTRTSPDAAIGAAWPTSLRPARASAAPRSTGAGPASGRTRCATRLRARTPGRRSRAGTTSATDRPRRGGHSRTAGRPAVTRHPCLGSSAQSTRDTAASETNSWETGPVYIRSDSRCTSPAASSARGGCSRSIGR